MFKSFIAPVALAALISFPAAASVTDNLLIGGFAGLTAGFISSAISRQGHHSHCRYRCRRKRCLCHRRPVVVEKQVYYKKPMMIEQPVVIEKRDHLKAQEFALKEQQMQLDLLREENKAKELALKEKKLALKMIKS